MIEIVWFKRDLRVHDHAALNSAMATGNPVLPLYIVEPELWAQPTQSARQFEFLRECLSDLDDALQKRGAQLVIQTGDAVDVLARLHREHEICAIHAHEETGLMWTYQRDKAVRAWAKRLGIPVIEHRQHGVWRGPIGRNGWAKRWDQWMGSPVLSTPPSLRFANIKSEPMPAFVDLRLKEDPCPRRQIGGRRQAIDLLRSFLEERGEFYRKAMSSPQSGAQACSRLSPHLAFGTLSIREAYQAAGRAIIRHRQSENRAFVASMTSFIARLHWHCHFIQKLESQPLIETENLHPSYNGLRPSSQNHQDLALAWIEGKTGFPFVDACMRSLAATGWLNFRMRAMAMSFSSYHLWQDWRWPAALLAQRFTDFEPGIHFPQAQMQSGTTGINTVRIYNPIKQSFDQDPEGHFIRTWVPELAHLPTPFVHEPWRAPDDLLSQALGTSDHHLIYPQRLIDHEGAAKSAQSQIHRVRNKAEHRPISETIQHQHGSRKSGLKPVRPGRKEIVEKKTSKPFSANQISFDF
jgi:deoxyribodipyrimidine photo-lyase